MRQLEDIVRKMENDELDIDSLAEQLKKAQELIKLCKDKLTKTDEEIRKLLRTEAFAARTQAYCYAWANS